MIRFIILLLNRSLLANVAFMLVLISSFSVEGSACARFEKQLQHYRSNFSSSAAVKPELMQIEESAVITRILSAIERSNELKLEFDLNVRVNNIKVRHTLGMSLATLNLMQLWAQQKAPNVVLLTSINSSGNISELQLHRGLLMNESYLGCQLGLQSNTTHTPATKQLESSQATIFKQLFTVLNTFYRNIDKASLQKLIDLRALHIDYQLKNTLAKLGYKSVVNWGDNDDKNNSKYLYFSLLKALETLHKISPNTYANVSFQITNMSPEDELLAEYVLVTLLHVELHRFNIKSINVNDIHPPSVIFIGNSQKIDSANKSIRSVLNNLLRLTEQDDM